MFSTRLPRRAQFFLSRSWSHRARRRVLPSPRCEFCGEVPQQDEPPGCVVQDDGDPCTDEICTDLGTTLHQPNTGGTCDDNNQCTTMARRLAGVGGGEAPTVCAEGNACSDGVYSNVCPGTTGIALPVIGGANTVAIAGTNGDGAKDIVVVKTILNIFPIRAMVHSAKPFKFRLTIKATRWRLPT